MTSINHLNYCHRWLRRYGRYGDGGVADGGARKGHDTFDTGVECKFFSGHTMYHTSNLIHRLNVGVSYKIARSIRWSILELNIDGAGTIVAIANNTDEPQTRPTFCAEIIMSAA